MVLSACGLKPSKPAQTPVAATPVVSTTQSIEPTAEPTATQQPNRVLLLASVEADQAQVSSLASLLGDLAGKSAMEFDTHTDPVDKPFSQETHLVVVIPPDPGVANLAASNPSIQFLAIGIPDLQPSTNLSLIGGGANSPDQVGFLAGYLASVITPDWRIGVIRSVDSIDGKAAGNGFKNGVIFFCGLCRPAFPPFVQYPVIIDLPVGATDAEIQAAVNVLSVNAVKTVFLTPGIDAPLVINNLASLGIKFIGVDTPPDELRSFWIATIKSDPTEAIQQVWQQLIDGQDGLHADVPLTIVDVNPDLLSQGRQLWVERLLREIAGGHIDTGVDPQTGEFR